MPKGREHEFAKDFIKLWKMKLGGWAYRIPDSWHTDPKTKRRYSHKRPADWIASCPVYSAMIEFKFLPQARTFKPLTHLRPSQIETIMCLNMNTLRYYLVVGNGDGAWAWRCTMFTLRNWEQGDVRLDLGFDEKCVGWYPYSGYPHYERLKGDPDAMLK